MNRCCHATIYITCQAKRSLLYMHHGAETLLATGRNENHLSDVKCDYSEDSSFLEYDSMSLAK